MSDLKREQIRQGANPMVGVPQHILDLLDRLHEESIKQESTMSYADYASRSEEEKSAAVRDKFIALDKDKAQLVYSLLRASDARTIVEAGTSFGVSTIYLALAAAANAKKGTGKKANVIATEHEPTKAAKAREYWQECGHEVSSVIDLREGDLRETLKDNLEDVDFLLLDSTSSHLLHYVYLGLFIVHTCANSANFLTSS